MEPRKRKMLKKMEVGKKKHEAHFAIYFLNRG